VFLHCVSLSILPNPGIERQRSAQVVPAIDGRATRLIAWFVHVRGKEIAIVVCDFVCEMVQLFCGAA